MYDAIPAGTVESVLTRAVKETTAATLKRPVVRIEPALLE